MVGLQSWHGLAKLWLPSNLDFPTTYAAHLHSNMWYTINTHGQCVREHGNVQPDAQQQTT
eukprot:7059533-Alexandrium_andersonii.AAC.1